MSLAQLLGISQQDAYQIAELAYQLIQQGKTKEAVKILDGLLVLNPQDNYLKSLLESAKSHDKKENKETEKS